MRIPRRAALIAILLLVGACVPKVKQPRIWLAGVKLSSVGLNGGVMDVRLGIYNPNTFDLKADGVRYRLEVQTPQGDGWTDFTEGRIDRDLAVPAGDSMEVAVPVDFTFRTLGHAAQALLDRGSFDYRVSGTVSVTGPVRRQLDFRHVGTVTESMVR